MNDTHGLIYCQPERDWTWRDKLRSKIFPFIPCPIPESPPSFQDVVITKCRSDLSLIDRLRVLITGKVETETRIVTENMVGQHRSNSVIRCGRFH